MPMSILARAWIVICWIACLFATTNAQAEAQPGCTITRPLYQVKASEYAYNSSTDSYTVHVIVDFIGTYRDDVSYSHCTSGGTENHTLTVSLGAYSQSVNYTVAYNYSYNTDQSNRVDQIFSFSAANYNSSSMVSGAYTFTAQSSPWAGVSTNSSVFPSRNSPPSVSNASLSINEDTSGSIALPYSDPDAGDTVTFSIASGPSVGSAYISGGSVVYTPPANWNGTTTLTFNAVDSDGAVSNTGTVNITVNPVNDTPSVVNRTLTTAEDTAGSLALTVTDVDLSFEGDSHTWEIVTAPNAAHGTASITGNTLTFTPVANWNGTTTLTYRARDSKNVISNTATVTINVTPVNDAPVASNRSLTTAEDTAGTVTLAATDVDGDSLTYSVVTAPNSAYGTVAISGNVATFTPKPNWNGTTTFTYRANDGSLNSNTATVTVTVTPVNDTPSVIDRSFTTNEDTAGTLALTVTDVDLSFEGDSHTWEIVTAPNAAHGTASISGSTLTFTPVANWNGTTTLTYRAKDSKSAISNTATVTITVTPVNDAPVASNRALTTAEDTAGTVTLAATDVDGDSLTYSVVTAPNSAHGTVSISGNVATFTPKPNWNGTTTFTYRANDGSLNSNTATVTVTVTPVNDTPSVSNSSLTTDEDTTGTLALTVTDVDLSFEGDSHTWEIVTAPNAAHGTASISGNTLTFVPAANWNGTTSLTYRARDSKGAISNTATVSITVNSVNDIPVATNVTKTTPEDTPVVIVAPATDVEDAGNLTYEIVTDLKQEEGRYVITGNQIEIIPGENFNGTLVLEYRAQDSNGAWSQNGKITVIVTAVNDAPSATGATITTNEGEASAPTKPWVADVDEPYGDTHTYSIATQPVSGTAKLVAGMLIYTPNTSFFGEDTFTITATDQAGLSVTGNVRVFVAKMNYAPTDIIPGEISFYEGIGSSAQLTVVDSNTWGSHTLEVVTQPAHGSVTIAGKELTFKTDGTTETRVTIRATDQEGLTFEKQITLKPRPASDFFDGRSVVETGVTASFPAVAKQMKNKVGAYAFTFSDAGVIDALGSEMVAYVTPDSAVGVSLLSRQLKQSQGMRFVPTVLKPGYMEAAIGGLDIGVDGTATILLSRADRSGPVYSVKAHAWAVEGGLAADKGFGEQRNRKCT